MMPRESRALRLALAGLLGALGLAPVAGHAHPMGNFSISHHASIRVQPTGVELRYLIDLAEIPTFQEIQDSGIVAEPGHPSLSPYLTRKVETLAEGLRLELNGRRLALDSRAREILFTPGAGDLSTMKLGIVYRAGLDGTAVPGANRLRYRDGLLVVYARRMMARVHGEGMVITRWLPLTSSAVMAGLGVAIAIQALMAGGTLQFRMS